MSNLKATVSQILIDTYPEAKNEELPMFAENRVHQRTSGNPFPSKVVLEAQRSIREKREYTLIVLENEFLELGILPALGGKIWYARDKKKDYNFFYKNNVIKPALIGVLGSWTSGGLEFNWPFHHRASTFMPVDYYIEESKDEITVWLSEHDPINRMKGMVGVSLKEGECIFTTKTKLDNLSPVRHSFLWWENTAVPVNESYEIFFPEDVNYVRFHYKRSVTTYPVANTTKLGAFNGIYYNEDTDISKHKNTRRATSYFSAESKYDYFGGYDNGIGGGVVHIADHHVSPGKKMFTWAYDQLAKTWENALTDNDGQYAELMAGCYSDNQPDLTWLEPSETKTFSQMWFPIHDCKIPTFANQNGALYITDEGIKLQAVKPFGVTHVSISKNGVSLVEKDISIPCYEIIDIADISRDVGTCINITCNNRPLFSYTISEKEDREIPEIRKELPYHKEVKTAHELYLEALHIDQYRSPEYSAKECYLEALERDPDFAPALIALAELSVKSLDARSALSYADRAESVLTRFNARLESGKAYYLKGLALLMNDRIDEGYDYLNKSAWCHDTRSVAMLHIGLLDIRRCDYENAVYHLSESTALNTKAVIAPAMLAYAYHMLGCDKECENTLATAFAKDKLNLYALAINSLISNDTDIFADYVSTDITQNLSDIFEVFAEAGMYSEICSLIEKTKKHKELGVILSYVYAAIKDTTASSCDIGIAFPSRYYEKVLLEKYISTHPSDAYALYLLGTLLYGRGLYAEGLAAFEQSLAAKEDFRTIRCIACAYYSHFHKEKEALDYMMRAAELAPKEAKQITFECAYLMGKMNCSPDRIIEFIISRGYDRDDITVELARAYNHAGLPDKALNLLLGRKFVACEGGEHYIADEYMYAFYLKGKALYEKGDFEGALSEFRSATVLPQSLGSGLWNPLKKVPFLYFEARSLIALGRSDEAYEILNGFKSYYFDYFTDMYLGTFAYYLGRAYEITGDKEAGDSIVLEKYNAMVKASSQITLGYYGTTPFFLSFVDDPENARTTSLAYPMFLYSTYLKNGKADEYRKTMNNDGYSLYIEDFTV